MKREYLMPIIKIIPRKIFIYLLYILKYKRLPNLKNPQLFSEKLNWIKYKKPQDIMSKLADKYEARKIIAQKIWWEHLCKIYGLYNNTQDIKLNTLPNKFALKATHWSGWNYICKNKSKINKKDIDSTTKNWFKRNYYNLWKELLYKPIKKRVVAEEYLEDSQWELLDYKFFCFNWAPKYIQIDVWRFSKHTRCFYDLKRNKQEFTLHFPLYKWKIQKPKNLNKMIKISETLSKEFDFVRVDLYNLDWKIYFWELTFTPGNWNEKFYPSKYDLILWKKLKLTKTY